MNKKLFGFTLAEVLITLAIIGVVAALTIPTLLANYQKKEWTTKLIKTHAEITQAIKLMMANDNTSSVSETEAWSSMTSNCKAGDDTLASDNCRKLREGFVSYLSGSSFIKIPNYPIGWIGSGTMTAYGPTQYGIRLSNGAIIINSTFYYKALPSNFEASNDKLNGYLFIDLNGYNKPNVLGRDIFGLRIFDDGAIEPRGSKRESLFNCGDESCTWSGENYIHNCRPDLETSRGEGCAARVLEQGKMDY